MVLSLNWWAFQRGMELLYRFINERLKEKGKGKALTFMGTAILSPSLTHRFHELSVLSVTTQGE